ncbi:hypothetical protein [Lysobacter sp. GCM10012299]|uniref:hypothetical protein n=1 Tax=Lysobacter sp. GCM10012299 TaxID=3317333 RepID=UPI00360C4C67
MNKDEKPVTRVYVPMPRQFKEFMSAVSEKIGEIHEANTQLYVAPENIQRLRHGRSWNVHPAETGTAGSFHSLSTTHEIKFDDLLANNIERLPQAVAQCAEGMHSEIARSIYSTIGEAADAVGNSVSSADHGNNLLEAIYAVIEKVEFSVDKFGNVSPPTLHVPPDIGRKLEELKSQLNPEFEARFEALMAAKAESALTAEEARKGKFINYGGSDEASVGNRL